ncbi:PREDICTED: uncharacterized protein LOC104813597 isoform X2 [Tarenaya hassleriana]|nr:PREDICTED: uncharacterized protein LOC104813597 isoform X2 [Tarenaya hassleriana]
MVHDGTVSSPVRRSQSMRKQYELGSCSTLVQRHRFLLTALVLLVFLCTIYLYFAITIGSRHSCTGLTGKDKAICQLEHARSSVSNGKLKFL